MTDKKELRYKRVILKISGESCKYEERSSPVDMYSPLSKEIAPEIAEIHKKGVEIGVVLGGGNIVRGRDLKNVDKKTADEMGMNATVINSLYLYDLLKKLGVDSRVMTATEMKEIAELYIRKRAVRHMEKGRIVILAGGLGKTGFTTDTAASHRAWELNAQAVLKGTKIDGLYKTYPPKKTGNPVKEITYRETMKLGAQDILDLAALGFLAQEKSDIVIHIFDIFKKGNLTKLMLGEEVGTRIISDKKVNDTP